MNVPFTDASLRVEPRLQSTDFNFSEIFNINSDSAFISGSVVEGLGNKSSDVDIYIITSSDLMDGMKINYTNTEVGYYNEINVRSREIHRNIRDKINGLNYKQYSEYLTDALVDDLDYYYRVCISVPLFENSTYLSDISGFSKDIAAKNKAHYYGYNAYSNFVKSKDMLELSQLGEAYHYANRALYYFYESVCAVNNECYTSQKSIYPRLARIRTLAPEWLAMFSENRYLGKQSIDAYCNKAFDLIENYAQDSFSFKNFAFPAADIDINYMPAGDMQNLEFVGKHIMLNGTKLYSLNEFCERVLHWIYSENIYSRKVLELKYSELKGGNSCNMPLFDDNIKTLLKYGLIELDE